MNDATRITGFLVAKLVLGTTILAAATGAAFAAWLSNGADIFRAMVEAGLAWCV